MSLDISCEIGITIFTNQQRRGSVDVRVSIVSGNQSDELESLDDWLQAEPALSGKIRLSKPVPQQGELGSLADALVVAVGAGGALSVLAGSLRAWLSQPRRSNVRIRLRGEGGRTVEISAERIDAQNIETLVREAFEFGSSGD
jgi:hypothetical protein